MKSGSQSRNRVIPLLRLLLFPGFAALTGCRQAEAPTPEKTLEPNPAQGDPAIAPQPVYDSTGHPDETNLAAELIEFESDRWLRVLKIRGDAKGAWATGDFDRIKNKIVVRTHDAAAFSIATNMLPVDWKKLVIISIDGSNSELRRRDHSVLVFEISGGGDWVVRDERSK